jgi:alpha/beta superfamily hydrolase
VIVETIDYRKIIAWINEAWAKSLAVVIMFVIGMWIGTVQTEMRVVGDCKYAGAFRVNHEAFVCQRRI